jgi:hypothetical protein
MMNGFVCKNTHFKGLVSWLKLGKLNNNRKWFFGFTSKKFMAVKSGARSATIAAFAKETETTVVKPINSQSILIFGQSKNYVESWRPRGGTFGKNTFTPAQ